MVTAPIDEANNFREILAKACRNVTSPWFHMPYADKDNIRSLSYRERVYCYELYHQIRLLCGPDGDSVFEYCLSGEIDKRGLDSVTLSGNEKPDFVWHVPGDSSHNATVVEVKHAKGCRIEGLRKDLETLATFIGAGERRYQEGILLIYGDEDHRKLCERVLVAAKRTHKSVGLGAAEKQAIRLLMHRWVNEPVVDLGTLDRL